MPVRVEAGHRQLAIDSVIAAQSMLLCWFFRACKGIQRNELFLDDCASTLVLAATTTLGAMTLAAAAPALSATAALKAADGKDVGTVTLTQTAAGVDLALALRGLPAGEHAFHVHAVGKCEPPFTSRVRTSTPA